MRPPSAVGGTAHAGASSRDATARSSASVSDADVAVEETRRRWDIYLWYTKCQTHHRDMDELVEAEQDLLQEAYGRKQVRVINPKRNRIHGCDGDRFVQFVATPAVEGQSGYLCIFEHGEHTLATFQGKLVNPCKDLMQCLDSVFEAVHKPDGTFVLIDCLYLTGKSLASFDVCTRLSAVRKCAPGAEIAPITRVAPDAPRPGEWYRPLNDAFLRTSVVPGVKTEQ